MMSSPRVRVSLDMVRSTYKRAGIPIYRADLPGGTLWGFFWNKRIIIGSTLDITRTMIDEVTGRNPTSHFNLKLAPLNPTIQGYFEEESE